jgi:hypothetical protein
MTLVVIGKHFQKGLDASYVKTKSIQIEKKLPIPTNGSGWLVLQKYYLQIASVRFSYKFSVVRNN